MSIDGNIVEHTSGIPVIRPNDTETDSDSSSSSSSQDVISELNADNISVVSADEIVRAAKNVSNKPKAINNYSILPTTVPPFALNQAFVKSTKTDVAYKNNESRDTDKFKDPFLHVPEDNWYKYLHNVGSNMEHLNENRKVSKSILRPLDEEWNGQERLDALFDDIIALNDQNKISFKTPAEKVEWQHYVANVIKYHYAADVDEQYRPSLFTTQSRRSSEKSEIDNGQNELKRHNRNWLEDKINKDKAKWNKLRRRKFKIWLPKISKLLIDSSHLPVFLRLLTWIFAIVSLALSTRIFVNIHSKKQQCASTIMTIIIYSISIVYLMIICRDEFSSKPLGLRDPTKKLRLIICDLLFIIFLSATLSLTFKTMTDKNWVCRNEEFKLPSTCRKQKALVSFELVTLLTWLISFMVSVLRVVMKVSTNLNKDEEDISTHVPLISGYG